MVASGRFRISAYEDRLPDGTPILRAIQDDARLAHWIPGRGWSRPVAERREHPGRWDDIRAVPPPVTVTLTKGRYY